MWWRHLQPVLFHVQLRVGWPDEPAGSMWERKGETTARCGWWTQVLISSANSPPTETPPSLPWARSALCLNKLIHIIIRFSKDVFPMTGSCIRGKRHIGLLIGSFPTWWWLTWFGIQSGWVRRERWERSQKKSVLKVRCRVFIECMSVSGISLHPLRASWHIRPSQSVSTSHGQSSFRVMISILLLFFLSRLYISKLPLVFLSFFSLLVPRSLLCCSLVMVLYVSNHLPAMQLHFLPQRLHLSSFLELFSTDMVLYSIWKILCMYLLFLLFTVI